MLEHKTVNNSFSTFFENIDYLSMLCLITLEDLEKEEKFLFVYNNPKLHRKKNCEIY